MTINIIVALAIALVLFFVLVAVWYFVAVPSKRKALAEEARENAEKEAEVIKQKKLLEVKEKFLSKRTELEKEVRQHNQQIQHPSRCLCAVPAGHGLRERLAGYAPNRRGG